MYVTFLNIYKVEKARTKWSITCGRIRDLVLTLINIITLHAYIPQYIDKILFPLASLLIKYPTHCILSRKSLKMDSG